jgi:hypothetical protein
MANESEAEESGAREWDRFFLKTIPEQRSFMKEFLKAQTRRKMLKW